MRLRRTLLLIALAALLAALLTACNRQATRPPNERIAILRFENLGSDSSSPDWMGRAFSEIISTELAGSQDFYAIPASRLHALNQTLGVRPISAPGISSERVLAVANGATRIGYGDYAVRNGRLEAQLTIEDPRTGKMIQVAASAAQAGDVIGAATDLAHQIAAHLAPYGTRNNRALEAWALALESNDNTVSGQELEAAIAADPDFVPPYRLMAQHKAQSRDRSGAVSILEQASSRATIPKLDRAQLEVELAELKGDAVGQQRTLGDLVQLTPRDPVAWHSLAESAMNRRQYPVAIQAFQKNLELEPEDAVAWNHLGYTLAYSGNLGDAMTALRRYQALRPADPDPVDSQGDVNLLLGHLREAEELYLQAARKSPAFPNSPEMFKAAMARLMTGDLTGADGISRQYADGRRAAHDPLVDLYEAEWQWATGRRKAGYQTLVEVAQRNEGGPGKEVAARAYGELALWALLLGDRPAATAMVQKALPLSTPASAALVVIARFLSQPPASGSEWALRAENLVPDPAQSGLRDATLVYALLFAREFQPASVLLKQLYDRASPNAEESLPILLAWTWCETGRGKNADRLLRMNPIPPLTGSGALYSLSFPRLYYLRGLEAQEAGNAEEARANFRLFLNLSGPDPLLWGEEAKAKALLGH